MSENGTDRGTNEKKIKLDDNPLEDLEQARAILAAQLDGKQVETVTENAGDHVMNAMTLIAQGYQSDSEEEGEIEHDDLKQTYIESKIRELAEQQREDEERELYEDQQDMETAAKEVKSRKRRSRTRSKERKPIKSKDMSPKRERMKSKSKSPGPMIKSVGSRVSPRKSNKENRSPYYDGRPNRSPAREYMDRERDRSKRSISLTRSASRGHSDR